MSVLELPRDILFEIFTLLYANGWPQATKVNRGQPSHRELEHAVFPFAMSHVCRAWRFAAIGMPSLWKCLVIMPRTPLGHLENVRRALERSTTIEVYLIYPELLHPARATAILSLLRARISTWTKFGLETSQRSTLSGIITALRFASAPLLEGFYMSYKREGYLREVFGPTQEILLGGAPRLRSLELVQIDDAPCMPPVSNITSLTLNARYCRYSSGGDHERLSIYLALLPSLKNLWLFDWVEPSGIAAGEAVHLPGLQALTVSRTRPGKVCPLSICDMLFTPNLDYLYFEGPDGRRGTNFDNYTAISALQYPNVRILVFLYASEKFKPGLNPFLQGMESLTHIQLRLKHLALVNDLLQQDISLWPHLQVLAITGSFLELRCSHPTDTCSWMTNICDFVWRREEVGLPLEQLYLEEDCFKEPYHTKHQADLSWLEERVRVTPYGFDDCDCTPSLRFPAKYR